MSKRKFFALSGLFGIVVATVLFVLGGPARAQVPTDPEPCVGTITGPGVATVTSGDCLLLAYAYDPEATDVGDFEASLPQTLHAQTAGSVGALTVDLPDCLWQVDLVQSDAVVVETLTDYYYGPNGWLVDDEHGGSVCEPEITTTTTTSTTILETTTTTSTSIPEITTTTTILPTTITTSVPQSNTLARTGLTDTLQLVVLALGLGGLGLVYLGWRLEN